MLQYGELCNQLNVRQILQIVVATRGQGIYMEILETEWNYVEILVIMIKGRRLLESLSASYELREILQVFKESLENSDGT